MGVIQVNCRRVLIIIGIAASALALTLFLVQRYKHFGGVYIGTYPTLTAKASNILTKLAGALNDEQKNTKAFLSDNFDLKTNYLDPLERIGEREGAPQNFRLLIDGLQLENKLVAKEADLNLNSLRILLSVDDGILRGQRYEQLDPALVVLEESFPDRDAIMSTLSDQQKTITRLLEIVRLGPPNNAEVRHFDKLKTISDLQGMKAEVVIEQYTKQIKVATKALREIVDDMAANR